MGIRDPDLIDRRMAGPVWPIRAYDQGRDRGVRAPLKTATVLDGLTGALIATMELSADEPLRAAVDALCRFRRSRPCIPI
jgi:hypothetical protein